jgi:hypothetical protein
MTMPGASWLADCDRLDELRERAGTGGYHASRELARLLADHDLLDELRDRISASGGHYALRELARRLIERDMHQELRELIEAADADTRQLILDAAGGASSAWPNALRVLADFGHKASRMHLARTLAREGRSPVTAPRCGRPQPRPRSARLAAPSSPRKFKIDQSERQHASPGSRGWQ